MCGLKGLPWSDVPTSHSHVDRPGKRITRTIRSFPSQNGLVSLAPRKSRSYLAPSLLCLITSADDVAAPPAVVISWMQGVLGIENKLAGT